MKKSSDEVEVEIRESNPSSNRYWNLRERDSKEIRGHSESEVLNDELSVNFNLNERRRLTENQKQVILNTLSRKPVTETDTESGGPENQFHRWKTFLLLIALSGPLLAILITQTLC